MTSERSKHDFLSLMFITNFYHKKIMLNSITFSERRKPAVQNGWVKRRMAQLVYLILQRQKILMVSDCMLSYLTKAVQAGSHVGSFIYGHLGKPSQLVRIIPAPVVNTFYAS